MGDNLREFPKKRLFKWIGGKTWLKDDIQKISAKIVKENTHTYLEPFAGGLGAFFAIYPNLSNVEKIVLNDINPSIIELYKAIKTEPNDVIEVLEVIEMEFFKKVPKKAYELHKTKDKIELKVLLAKAEKYYKDRRSEFNNRKIKIVDVRTVALFLFLMEHSFNAIYRENSSGGFNTPFNWDNKKYNFDSRKEIILEYHKFFVANDIVFENMDVFELLTKYDNKESFIYLDPPYLNENESENKYNKNSFTYQHQIKLLEETVRFDSFLYSNHYLKTIKNFFDKEGVKYDKKARKNIISACNESRKTDIFEILAFR